MEISCTTLLDDLRAAVRGAAERGSPTAARCTLAASARAVERALAHEANAERAALSLAQRETLGALGDELRVAFAVLHDALDACGGDQLVTSDAPGRLLALKQAYGRWRSGERPADRLEVPSWWTALTQAIDGLDGASGRLDGIAAGQPPEAPARAVAERTAGLLRAHHDRLLRLAERWLL